MKVAVGLSGGVDSAVTAYLLQQKGYDVVGVFLRTWDERDPDCPQSRDQADAKAVAEQLGIPFRTYDLSGVYRDKVFANFLSELEKGRTPNPDVLCNRAVKFGGFVDLLPELGCSHVATGHYAKVTEINGLFALEKPKDRNKDQTYFLWTLTQNQLSKALFPLSEIDKNEVREIAEQLHLVNAKKRDSVGICMVGDRDFPQFVQQYLAPKKGEIREWNTEKKLGEHNGVQVFTLGQRRGHGVGGVKNRPEAPWFVVAKDLAQNILYVHQDESLLGKTQLRLSDIHWTSGTLPITESLSAQIRYRSHPIPCAYDAGVVTFLDPAMAPTPGQSVVFYDANILLGGGIIDQVLV